MPNARLIDSVRVLDSAAVAPPPLAAALGCLPAFPGVLVAAGTLPVPQAVRRSPGQHPHVDTVGGMPALLGDLVDGELEPARHADRDPLDLIRGVEDGLGLRLRAIRGDVQRIASGDDFEPCVPAAARFVQRIDDLGKQVEDGTFLVDAPAFEKTLDVCAALSIIDEADGLRQGVTDGGKVDG